MTSNPHPPATAPQTTPVPGPGSVRQLIWPLLLVLAVISIPAGFMPFVARDAHREMVTTAGAAPQNMDRLAWAQRHNKAISTYRFILEMATSLVILHLAVSTWGVVRRNRLLMGMRGTTLAVMCWIAFLIGAGAGLWVYRGTPA